MFTPETGKDPESDYVRDLFERIKLARINASSGIFETEREDTYDAEFEEALKRYTGREKEEEE